MVSRPRSPPASPAPPESKRRKTVSEPDQSTRHFHPGLLDESSVASLNAQYAASQPYKHAVIPKLFSDELLKSVKNEILDNVSFTEKETDIYKVHQTGDLASLSYLTPEQQALFPSLLKLREALYSPEFRSFLRGVTGCGPLSGRKQDMSVNSYRKGEYQCTIHQHLTRHHLGCHLLNHDDVIGTRRVSYILYMPLPLDQPWKPEWGGALELYPITTLADGSLEPESRTEEVVVDEADSQRQRLSISGWFHRPQEGEEGYDENDIPKEKSSLQQLSTSSNTPLQPYPSDAESPPSPEILALNEEDKTFLSQFLNPTYLNPKAIEILAAKFLEESSVQLHMFLLDSLASELESGIKSLDDKANQAHRTASIPSHDYGSDEPGWELVGPPHRLRYYQATDELAGQQGAAGIIHRLRTELLPSPAFRSWLAAVTSLVPLAYTVAARRFRPGLDYTLASAVEGETRLDVCLGLTPEAGTDREGWEQGTWGGWDASFYSSYSLDYFVDPPSIIVLYGASRGRRRPEVYKSSGSNPKKGQSKSEHSKSTADPKGKGKAKADPEEDEDMSEDEDDDGTLLTVQPGFNRLVIALRDAGVLKFVKKSVGCGEWEAGMLEADDESREEDV
ncbi:prolyl 3,4-dihydroxylase ofd1 [Ceratobasidium sp. AG-Ba]|nr:prolyl 3,4-dihydroxylase ofd1 [Ceratobasidium sp. AG-Ba]